jgi:S1-C subfamily serine protease
MIVLAAMAAIHNAPAWGADGAEPPGGAMFLLGGSGAPPVRGGQGYLGVDLRDVTADQLGALRLREAKGAEIILVDHDAPAGKAGLREHDVVLQMNGQAIDGQDQIRRMLHDSPPGRTVVLVISRDGQQMTVTAQLANKEEVERQAWEQHLTVPEPQPSTSENVDTDFSSGSASPAPAVRGGNSFIGALLMNPSYTGALLEKMSTQQAAYFGAASSAGLLVRSVVPNSPAALAGMQACDVIVKANEHAIATSGDWSKAIKNSHGKPLTVVVLRDKKQQTLTLTPDGKKRSSVNQPGENGDGISLAHLGPSWMPRS